MVLILIKKHRSVFKILLVNTGFDDQEHCHMPGDNENVYKEIGADSRYHILNQ